MLKDISIFFSGEEDEYETSQQYISMKELFRGFVVKDQEEVNFNCNKFRDLNKVFIVNEVLFYKECWVHRNEYYFNEENKEKGWYSGKKK